MAPSVIAPAIVVTTIAGAITLGAMTMYILLFRQGQSAVAAILTAISGMYEDNLYLSNLYDYLEQPVPTRRGEAVPREGGDRVVDQRADRGVGRAVDRLAGEAGDEGLGALGPVDHRPVDHRELEALARELTQEAEA